MPDPSDLRLRVGCHGLNGHQILHALVDHPEARLVAVSAIPRDALPEALRDNPDIRHYDNLDALLADDSVAMVSLCSPRRADQADDTLRAFARGKHVYAEKPCALHEDGLDALLDAARARQCRFLEMGGSAAGGPWRALRALVRDGALGDIVQVVAQKSYPWHDGRPFDDAIDGGLVAQAGVHAYRWIERVAGLRVASVLAAVRTAVHAPDPRVPAWAASVILRLENGGLASVTVNYLNPRGFPEWGNDQLRVFGTRGMAEIVDGGARTRWYDADTDHGPLPSTDPFDYLTAALRYFRDGTPLPDEFDDEIHATRIALRADALARRDEAGDETGTGASPKTRS